MFSHIIASDGFGQRILVRIDAAAVAIEILAVVMITVAVFVSVGRYLFQAVLRPEDEEREVPLIIQPPLPLQGRAGRHPLIVRVANQGTPQRAAEVTCTLEPPAEEPPTAENLPAEPSEGGLPCAPAAAGLILVPLLVASRKRRSRRRQQSSPSKGMGANSGWTLLESRVLPVCWRVV